MELHHKDTELSRIKAHLQQLQVTKAVTVNTDTMHRKFPLKTLHGIQSFLLEHAIDGYGINLA